MIHLILRWHSKMVSFLLILLIQFQTGSYNFLHASDSAVSEKSSQIFLHNGNLSTSLESKGKQNAHEPFAWAEGETDSTKNDPLEIMFFEQKLLKLLGMKERPKINKNIKVTVPKYLQQLYNNQLEKDVPTSNLNLPGRFTKSANTIRSFYHFGKERKLLGLNTHLRFDLSSIPDTEELTGAELRIPLTMESSSEEKEEASLFQVLVHDVVKIPKSSHNNHPISYPVDSKSVKSATFNNPDESQANSTVWLTFDVFPAVSRWSSLKNRKSNLNLAIEIIDRRRKGKLPEIPITTTSENPLMQTNNNNLRVKRSSTKPGAIAKSGNSEVPMLLTYSDDGHNSRKPRDAKTLSRNYRSFQNQRRRRNHRHKNRRRNLCSRKKMFVDFTDVGWNDWIVAPPGYQAFYCSGECPFPMSEHLNATNHAVIQALVNSMNPRLVPPPCCVPNKYSSLSLLYTDSSDRIVLKNYNEMVVDSCGCS